MRRIGVLSLLVVLTVAGCGTGSEKTAASPAPSAVPTTSPPATPSPSTTRPLGTPTPTSAPRSVPSPPPLRTPTGPVRVGKGHTRPGTRLRFGQKAIVPIRDYDSFTKRYTEGVIGVAPGPIKAIPASRLEGNYDARSRAVLKGRTAYYSRIVITNESGNDLSGILVPAIKGLRRNGQPPDVALLGGDIPGCREDVSAPDTFNRKGATWVTCEFEVSSAARPVRVIAYHAPPYGIEPRLFDDPPPRFNRYYGLGEITWR